MATVTATGPFDSWGELLGPTYTPTFGALPSAPGAYFPASWNAGTQKFSWDITSSSAGHYVWSVSGMNSASSDVGMITVNLTLPEPGTAALFFVGLIGLFGSCRSRILA